MPTYAIGDIQACHDELAELLELLHFDSNTDQLWFTGDLIGRGPKPLETLRSVYALGDAATVVLGNHDLHLLAQACGVVAESRGDPSFKQVINAPDGEALLRWLRHRPLLHIDPELGFGLIHAGLPPQWDTPTAESCAREVETALRSDDYKEFLTSMYGNEPELWQAELGGAARLRFITNCLTRLRFCHPGGRLALDEKGSPTTDTPDLTPWFAMPERRSTDLQWIFGHWSTLGQVAWPEQRVYGLDSGCLWGGALTALCLQSGELTSVSCKGYRKPA